MIISRKKKIAQIMLTRENIKDSMPKIKYGLDKYLWIQNETKKQDFFNCRNFRKTFNGFYVIRRDEQWQNTFYNLMGSEEVKQFEFKDVLEYLHKETKRYEASYASKLVATLKPSMPVIDAYVLKNLNLKLPHANATGRIDKICHVYKTIIELFAEFLVGDDGKYLVEQFTNIYGSAQITEVKMLDLILWQTRE